MFEDLESGLDLFERLKFLRRLEVINMEHRIGLQEVKWLDHVLTGLSLLQEMKRRPGVNNNHWPVEIYAFPRKGILSDPESLECNVGFSSVCVCAVKERQGDILRPAKPPADDHKLTASFFIPLFTPTRTPPPHAHTYTSMNNTHSARTIAIPELVREIANLLTCYDFTQLVCVCKSWHDAFIPHLWRDIRILTNQQQTDFMNPVIQEALIRHRDLVRSLWCHVRSSANPLASLGTTRVQLHLTNIHLYHPRGDDDKDHQQGAMALFGSLMGILEQSPFLATLDIPVPPPTGAFVESLLQCIAKSLPRLRRLSLFASYEPHVGPEVAKVFFETCSAELEYLSIGIKFCQDGSGTETTSRLLDQPIPGSRPHPKLKCFALYSDVDGDKDNKIGPLVLSVFLRGCTNLEVVDDWMVGAVRRKLWPWAYPTVKEILSNVLGVRWSQAMNAPKQDGEIANEISLIFRTNTDTSSSSSSSPPSTAQERWHTIMIDKCPATMTLTNKALLSAATTRQGLAVLSVDKWDSMKSSDVQAILLHGRALRHVSSTFLPTITITDMLQSPTWSCRWIVNLKIQITGIPRPDIYTDYRNSLIPTLLGVSMKQSRCIQRQVYAQLGTLICLRRLVLGAVSPASELETSTDFKGTPIFFDRRLQVSCLEMTLESGLDLLCGLLELEVLCVENMDHRVGVAELLWMEKTWPNIKRVTGLLRCRDGDRIWGARVAHSGRSIAPGRPSGSKREVLDCQVGFNFS
ncbi:MAG: hypothetical protein J3R72DRAFT_148166 [Linnemannia gamsii]|nr:MAG: hypothetical protein J3R72DRAFT_148166 [Linnemannia gamsii]